VRRPPCVQCKGRKGKEKKACEPQQWEKVKGMDGKVGPCRSRFSDDWIERVVGRWVCCGGVGGGGGVCGLRMVGGAVNEGEGS
jgi:hypothetical protein